MHLKKLNYDNINFTKLWFLKNIQTHSKNADIDTMNKIK